MGLDDFPQKEVLTEWQQRILSGAVDVYKNELQNQEIEGVELDEKLNEFKVLAEGLASEKKNEWSEMLGKIGTGGVDEDSAEDIENKLSQGLFFVTKDKLKEAV